MPNPKEYLAEIDFAIERFDLGKLALKYDPATKTALACLKFTKRILDAERLYKTAPVLRNLKKLRALEQRYAKIRKEIK